MVVRSSPRVAWIPKSSGLVLLSLFTACLAVTSPLSRADTDLVQHGGITLDPNDPGPVVLEWLGRAYDNPTGPAPGLTLSYHDDVTANGIFRLFRSSGQYQWQLSTATGDPRLAMTLGNDHSLTLVDPANDTQTIVLRPGASGVGGVFVNGQRLLTSTEVSTSFLPINPLRLNVGTNATTGTTVGSAAIGQSSQVLFDDSVAMGNSARAFSADSFALGKNALVAANSAASLAIGHTASANGLRSSALGPNATAAGSYSLAIGSLAAASGSGSTALGSSSNASGSSAVSIGNGLATGLASVAINASAFGLESVALSSGIASGDYSFAVGAGTWAYLPHQFVAGYYNSLPFNPSSYHSAPRAAEDAIFVIGNGMDPEIVDDGDGGTIITEHRSDAFTVAWNGNTRVAGAVTVEGGTAATPVTSVFQRDVHVQGVLRVPAAGDISMGTFKSGTNPVPLP